MFQSKAFGWAVWTLLILLIVWMAREVSFIFRGVVVLSQTFFVPVFLSGMLYYLFMPLVNFLHRYRVPKPMAVLLIYIFLGSLIVLSILFLSPLIYREFAELVNDVSVLINTILSRFNDLQNSSFFARFEEMDAVSFEGMVNNIAEYILLGIASVSSNVTSVAGFFANLFLTLLLVSFILYYLLLGDSNPLRLILRVVPEQHKDEAEGILTEMNNTLGRYIQGQLLVSFCVGLLVYAGLLIIGMNYALVLAIVAMLTNIVPYIGATIVLILTVVLALLISPWMALKALIVFIVIQQLEALVISPRIIGKKLDMHPISIILVIVFASRLAGFLGVILAIPAYAVIKLVTVHMIRLIKLRKMQDN